MAAVSAFLAQIISQNETPTAASSKASDFPSFPSALDEGDAAAEESIPLDNAALLSPLGSLSDYKALGVCGIVIYKDKTWIKEVYQFLLICRTVTQSADQQTGGLLRSKLCAFESPHKRTVQIADDLEQGSNNKVTRINALNAERTELSKQIQQRLSKRGSTLTARMEKRDAKAEHLTHLMMQLKIMKRDDKNNVEKMNELLLVRNASSSDALQKIFAMLNSKRRSMEALEAEIAQLSEGKAEDDTDNGSTGGDALLDEDEVKNATDEVRLRELDNEIQILEDAKNAELAAVNSLMDSKTLSVNPHDIEDLCKSSPALNDSVTQLSAIFTLYERIAQLLLTHMIDSKSKGKNWSAYHIRGAIRSENPGSGPYMSALWTFKLLLLKKDGEFVLADDELALLDRVLDENSSLKKMLNYE